MERRGNRRKEGVYGMDIIRGEDFNDLLNILIGYEILFYRRTLLTLSNFLNNNCIFNLTSDFACRFVQRIE